MEAYDVKVVSTTQEREAAFAIRERVFMVEQHVSRAIELDGEDAKPTTTLFLAYADGKPVATARLLTEDADGRLGRMAVLADYRRQGVGSALLAFVMDEARRRGLARLTLHAQAHARNFYLLAGFAECGAPFVEADILHIEMTKDLVG